MRIRQQAFTLVEMLISIAVLTMIVVLVTRLFNSATAVTTTGHKRMDAEGHARPLFDRIGVDFTRMLRRTDVDYFFKSAANPQSGNDQIAFFSIVAGYYPLSGSQSPLSLVAYRVSAQHQVERMGKGLVWNGVSDVNTPLVFLPLTINEFWPASTDSSSDPDYDLIGPQAFRFEYYYLLRNGSLSDTPWDVGAGRTSISGLIDVAAIVVTIATIDPRSRVIVSDTQLADLSGLLPDFSLGSGPGHLAQQWQEAINNASGVPRAAASSIRIYERYYPIGAR